MPIIIMALRICAGILEYKYLSQAMSTGARKQGNIFVLRLGCAQICYHTFL